MGNGLGSRRTLLAIVCSATGMGCVAEAEAPSPGEQTEQRQAPVYKGDVVPDGDAFAGGHVFLRAQSSVAGMPGVGGELCSGTFVAPNWILTARHCVFNELGAKYAKLEARIGPAGSPSWQGTCPVVDIRPDANHVPVAAPILAGKLKRPVLRAFPRPLLQLAPVGCVVVGHPEPTIDIALIDLNGFPGLTRGIPGYPAWPNGTVLYGGPRSALDDTNATCFGHGKDASLQGSSSEVLRSALVRLKLSPNTGGVVTFDDSEIALLPLSKDAAIVDHGDSGGACVRNSPDGSTRAVRAVNAQAFTAKNASWPFVASATAADAWLDWVTAKLYARTPFDAQGIATAFPAAAAGARSTYESKLDDVNGDGNLDFVSWNAPNLFVTALGKGDGSFQPATTSPRDGRCAQRVSSQARVASSNS